MEKERKRGRGPPARKSRREARGKERERETKRMEWMEGSEREERESAWMARGREERGENTSYSAQHPRWRWQRLPSSLKSIIKKYIRGHLRFSSVS